MTTDTARPEKLDIGRVIQTTFGGLRHSFVRLLPLVGLLVVLPGLLAWVSTLARGGLMATSYIFSPLYFLNFVVGLLAGTVFQAAGIQILASDMRGTPIDVRTSLRNSLIHILPLFAILVLYVLAIWAGMILLLVPGIMIAVAFSVVIPVRVLERAGVFAVFGRSRQLTRGNRWRITGLLFVFIVITGVFEMVIFSLFGGITNIAALSKAASIGMGLSLQLFGVVFGLIGLAGSYSLYAELRRIKDGIGSSDLAAVFD
jgi:hypothetical protein